MRWIPHICLGLATLQAFGPAARAGQPFAIEVVDASTGRGVPLIELRTVNEIRPVTDSAGLVAFDEPGLMGRSVYFHVRGHGYELAPDGFGNRGRALDVAAGGSARIEVRRVNIAERLYRVTGGGIYRDSLLLGRQPPIREPAARTRRSWVGQRPGSDLRAARSTGSGATPTARATPWATSTRRRPPRCRPGPAGSTPRSASTSTTPSPPTASPPPRPGCPATARPGSTA